MRHSDPSQPNSPDLPLQPSPSASAPHCPRAPRPRRLGDDCIYVYGDDCKLIKDKSDKRSSVKVDGVTQFMWSPTDNVVSLWVPEHTNNPAKVVLMELPS